MPKLASFNPDIPVRRYRKRAEGAVARKARALWISLHQLGAIDNPSELALEMFARRQFGVDHLQWADETQGFRLIEALKAIADRHGWSQAVPNHLRGMEAVHWLKVGLLDAQLAQLAQLAPKEAASLAVLAGDRSSWSFDDLERASAALATLLFERRRRAS